MLRRSKVNILTTLSSALLCLPLCAASLLAQKTDDQAVFRTDTRLVVLPVTVVDKSGRLITTLPQSAFQVFENGAPQKIKLFKREDVPVSMGLVIDNSGSMRDKRREGRRCAVALVKDSNKEDEAFIVNFNDDAYIDTPDFTNDISCSIRR